ncbi:protein of unknown function [Nitrospira japonica]|uniref:SF3 helicase domain-containing protein n=1 Tax=Nitrospira japonica TaxID=1325564 RepID=A0A1W1I8A6_9BACT|nr:phage/plasmid primase, P4 family [Nitrospira japonica]SLM49230.1 protein of unknown function [Nitrospira japonica]
MTSIRNDTENRAGVETGAPLQSRPLTAADWADEYLTARGLVTVAGLWLRKHRGEWLRYNGAYYESLTPEALEADVTTYFNGTLYRDRVNKAFVSGIIHQLTARCLMPDIDLPAEYHGGAWNPVRDAGIVVLKNGIVRLASVGHLPDLQAHSCQLVTRCALPFNYDPAATCPAWLKFLEHILPDDATRTLLQQIFGYCLTFDMKHQKFFLFEGTGGNGKSVVTRILRRVVGAQNTSSLPLNRFGDKHGLVGTYGKLVNVTGELREKDTVAEDLLKQATGGDAMYFEPKYKTSFTAPFTAKIILCTNERPTFTDRSNGLWRRLVVLPFPVSIPPEEQDPELETRLSLELPGVLNWAIQGAVSLNNAGRFIEPPQSKAAGEEFRDQANHERAFLKERCCLEKHARIGAQDLYDAYRLDAQRGGYKPLSRTKFRKEVLSLSGVKEDRLRKADGTRPHIFHGITTNHRGPIASRSSWLSEVGPDRGQSIA